MEINEIGPMKSSPPEAALPASHRATPVAGVTCQAQCWGLAEMGRGKSCCWKTQSSKGRAQHS